MLFRSDDRIENVEAAQRFGMQAICFEDAAQYERESVSYTHLEGFFDRISAIHILIPFAVYQEMIEFFSLFVGLEYLVKRFKVFVRCV